MGVKKCLPEREIRVPAAGNVSICCRCYGTGERVVVLLHGNGEDYRCFDRQLDLFAQSYRVLAIDSRGHGSSGMGEPFSLRAMADDVKTVLDALGIPKASLIGFSDGGNVALYFALRYPSRLEKLVVAGANLSLEGLTKRERRRDKVVWGILRFGGRFSSGMRKKALVYGLMVTEPDIDPWELETIEAPTLVLAGERDMIREQHTKLIAKSIPGARLRIIPSSDHFIFRNQPGWVNTIILKFLSVSQDQQ